jgi:lipoprotein-anchoring transpeptidase ErfK/SrfK
MRGAIRSLLVVVGIMALGTVGSVNPSFATVAPSPAAVAVSSIQPANGQVVGVAQPVDIEFSRPVADRAAAERGIRIMTSRVVTGHFSWTNDTVAQWIPDGLWPAHSQVTVLGGDFAASFETGAAVVGVADLSAHTFTVSIDDQVVREMPASMGKPKYPTPVGSFAALQKQRNVTFDSRTIGIPLNSSEGYLINGEYAVRVTWGGVYVHSAPWSLGSQGKANVSHGCINLSPDNAAWYFDTVNVGDPIIVQP